MSKPKVGYLQVEGADFGPFSMKELKEVMEKGKLTGQLFVWNEGERKWSSVDSVPELFEIFESASQGVQDGPPVVMHGGVEPPKLEGENKRTLSREPLIAAVHLLDHGGSDRTVGLVRDISETGFQLINEQGHPFEKGKEYSFGIEPLGVTGLGAIQVDARAMWVNDESKKAGFQFINLSQAHQQVLIAYLEVCRRKKQDLV